MVYARPPRAVPQSPGQDAQLNLQSNALHRTVSLAIEAPDTSGRILAVRRPPDDPDLPDAWGLPAGRVRPEESLQAAAVRVGREKLGVEIEGVAPLRRGSTPRPDYRLEMDLVRARIASGEPVVPQPGAGVTQYSAWRWADPGVLEAAAARGSLCCRLFFESRSNGPSTPLEGTTP
jgi:8-oxo-dGTP diphosphatase